MTPGDDEAPVFGANLQAKGNMGFSADNSREGAGSSGPPPSSQRSGGLGPQPTDAKADSYGVLLDAVLQQTLLTEKAEAQERLESLDELLELARRRRGEAFLLDPIAVELVQTVLGMPFRALVASDDQWLSMTRQVAETLCDDPTSYDRLNSLWRRLNERCGNGN
ncbi:MAG: hypothetical protein WD894_06730 [Pirellulales bacterium]